MNQRWVNLRIRRKFQPADSHGYEQALFDSPRE